MRQVGIFNRHENHIRFRVFGSHSFGQENAFEAPGAVGRNEHTDTPATFTYQLEDSSEPGASKTFKPHRSRKPQIEYRLTVSDSVTRRVGTTVFPSRRRSHNRFARSLRDNLRANRASHLVDSIWCRNRPLVSTALWMGLKR